MIASTANNPQRNGDQWGTWASGLCAVHCALSPLIIIALPNLGSLWSSPLAHVIGAALVVPLALIVLERGRRRHHCRWPLTLGILGSLALIVALLPAWSQISGISFSWGTGVDGMLAETADACCSTVSISRASGIIVLPWPTIITFVGSLLLISGHLGNSAQRQSSGSCR